MQQNHQISSFFLLSFFVFNQPFINVFVCHWIRASRLVYNRFKHDLAHRLLFNVLLFFFIFVFSFCISKYRAWMTRENSSFSFNPRAEQSRSRTIHIHIYFCIEKNLSFSFSTLWFSHTAFDYIVSFPLIHCLSWFLPVFSLLSFVFVLFINYFSFWVLFLFSSNASFALSSFFFCSSVLASDIDRTKYSLIYIICAQIHSV